MTNDDFIRSVLLFIIDKNEGGYVWDKNDKGGETKYGIAKAYHPNLDIKNLTKAQAVEIYLKEYYKPLEKLIDTRDEQLTYQVLDHAINAGVSRAKTLLATAKTADQYKAARLRYYKSLKQFTLYGKSWTNRTNRTFA